MRMKILTQLIERFRENEQKNMLYTSLLQAVILIVGKIIEDIPGTARAIRFQVLSRGRIKPWGASVLPPLQL